MAFVSLIDGLLYPRPSFASTQNATTMTIDAATEKAAFIGYCYIPGGGAKTISAAGGGSIWFMSSTTTFAAAAGATTIDVGIQDVATGTGPPAEPDGTFDVKRTLVSGTDTIGGAVHKEVTMTGGTGTKTITNGDLIAIVADMTARGGADSVTFTYQSVVTNHLPTTNAFVGGVWGVGTEGVPVATFIKFDDGTYGWLNGQAGPGAATRTTYTDASGTDENGILIQVPFPCKVNAVWALISAATDGTSDFTINVVSDPTGSPSQLATVNVLGEQMGNVGAVGADPGMLFPIPELTLAANTNYGIGIKATGAGNIVLHTFNAIGSTSFFQMMGHTAIRSLTRNGGSGAYASVATTVQRLGFRISAVDDGAGGGGGSSAVNVVQANVGVLTNTIGY